MLYIFHDFSKLSQPLPLVWMSHILCMYLYYKVRGGGTWVLLHLFLGSHWFSYISSFAHKLLFPTLFDTLRQWGVTTAGAVEAARVRLRSHLDNPSQVEKCDLDKWWLALPIGANKTILPEPTQSTESLTVVTSAAKIFVEKNWNRKWNFLWLSPEGVRRAEGENISSRTW